MLAETRRLDDAWIAELAAGVLPSRGDERVRGRGIVALVREVGPTTTWSARERRSGRGHPIRRHPRTRPTSGWDASRD